MKIIADIFTNPIFLSAASAWFTAQAGKVILHFILNGFSLKRVVGGGGMPSSHSATVTGLTVGTALFYGVKGFEFPMALFFSFVVIYDAMGVRLTTGKQARILNQMAERDRQEGKTPVQTEKLDELMGHTLPEIVVGIVIGILCAVVIWTIWR